jgi:NAD(P)H dehydrogenase (quinone)
LQPSPEISNGLYIVYAPVRQTDAVRQSILDDFSQRLQTITSELPIAVGQY